jgi:voltage-gated potassium channel
MDRRRLYRLLDPDSADRSARTFRLVHHTAVVAGIGIMMAVTVGPMEAAYELSLAIAFAIVAAFFVVEYVLRLIASPEKPGSDHYGPWQARLVWAVSFSGLFDLLCALPGVIALFEWHAATIHGGIWMFKFIRYSPGLASLRRVVGNARDALLSVLLGFCIVLVVAATLAYLLERDVNPRDFGSIPNALWWAIVTLTTTGYGDVVPLTIGGRMLAGTVMVSGILVFALWAGILASGYAEESRRREFLRTWDLVAKVPFFHNIGAPLIAEVARLLRPREYQSGATIVRRGEQGDCMFFVVEGEVEVQIQPEPVFLGAGQFFGELALLTRAPRNASVIATKPCWALALDIVDFHELLARQPELARVIHEEAIRRLGPDAPPLLVPVAAAMAAEGSG